MLRSHLGSSLSQAIASKAAATNLEQIRDNGQLEGALRPLHFCGALCRSRLFDSAWSCLREGQLRNHELRGRVDEAERKSWQGWQRIHSNGWSADPEWDWDALGIARVPQQQCCLYPHEHKGWRWLLVVGLCEKLCSAMLHILQRWCEYAWDRGGEEGMNIA